MTNRRRFLALSATSLTAALYGLPALAEHPPMPDELRQAIERQAFSPVLGNPKGNITLTEFFDYNCPVCKEVSGLLRQLIAADTQLRIVLREWPVIRPESAGVAQISLAALKQGKYWQFHEKMLAQKGAAQEQSALRVARDLGLDIERLRKDMQSRDVGEHIQQSMDLGDHMGLMGTPTFIAGNQALFGRQTLADLQALVKSARKDLL